MSDFDWDKESEPAFDWKSEAEPMRQEAKPTPAPPPKHEVGAAQTFADRVGNWGAFGFGDEAGAALQAGLLKLTGDPEDVGQLYRRARGLNRREYELGGEQNPTAAKIGAGTGVVLNTIATAPLTGLKGVAAGAQGLKAAIGAGAKLGAQTGFVNGTLSGLGNSEADLTTGNWDELEHAGLDMALGGGTGGLLGGVLGGATAAGGYGLRAVKDYIKAKLPAAKEAVVKAVRDAQQSGVNDAVAQGNKEALAEFKEMAAKEAEQAARAEAGTAGGRGRPSGAGEAMARSARAHQGGMASADVNAANAVLANPEKFPPEVVAEARQLLSSAKVSGVANNDAAAHRLMVANSGPRTQIASPEEFEAMGAGNKPQQWLGMEEATPIPKGKATFAGTEYDPMTVEPINWAEDLAQPSTVGGPQTAAQSGVQQVGQNDLGQMVAPKDSKWHGDAYKALQALNQNIPMEEKLRILDAFQKQQAYADAAASPLAGKGAGLKDVAKGAIHGAKHAAPMALPMGMANHKLGAAIEGVGAVYGGAKGAFDAMSPVQKVSALEAAQKLLPDTENWGPAKDFLYRNVLGGTFSRRVPLIGATEAVEANQEPNNYGKKDDRQP